MVSGYTKPLILLPSESVWVSLSRTMEKTTIERDAEKQESEEERETEEKTRTARRRQPEVVVSSSKSTFIHSTWEGSSITRAFEIFGALPTPLGITLEIDVARPRNLGPFRLLDFSRLPRTSFFLLDYLETRKEHIYYTCRDPGAAHGIRAFVAVSTRTWRGKWYIA